MECPFCFSSVTSVVNSRPTKSLSQIWRRRKCQSCGQVFTTQEHVDLSHVIVIKKSGKRERFSRAKLFSGIYVDIWGKNREGRTEEVVFKIEQTILALKKNKLMTSEIGGVVLNVLKTKEPGAFLKFLAYSKKINDISQMSLEIKKYLGN